MDPLSPLRLRLASFENCYSVAARRCAATGRAQFIVRTGNALQPLRVSSSPPRRGEQLATLIA